jgi:hypothetical protein
VAFLFLVFALIAGVWPEASQHTRLAVIAGDKRVAFAQGSAGDEAIQLDPSLKLAMTKAALLATESIEC